MFERTILSQLQGWQIRSDRKPLIIRGARQVGKTTVVKQFSTRFDQFIYLNLELPEDRKPFEEFQNMDILLQRLFLLKNLSLAKKELTLIFIDEIQEVTQALQQLRFFYEQVPEVSVIAAGSLLESLFEPEISFPVGRVEYLAIYPVSFPEFLNATGEHGAFEQIQKIPMPDFAVSRLMHLFRTYCLVGGMPEVVAHYSENKDLTALGRIFESLLTSYIDDVEKYARNKSHTEYLRHAIRASFAEAGKRIKFQGFGHSAYRSREMGEALRTLEKALLIHLIFPQTSPVLPLQPDYGKSPRLQFLDTGMLNYFLGIQADILGTSELNSIYHGTMIEHMVGQELLASQYSTIHDLQFWVREKNTASAEVDYLFAFEGKLVPIEVKSGPGGKLKSLHQFIELAPHELAVRFYSGPVQITTHTTPKGKGFYLLNLPYFLVSQIKFYLTWFEKEIKK